MKKNSYSVNQNFSKAIVTLLRGNFGLLEDMEQLSGFETMILEVL